MLKRKQIKHSRLVSQVQEPGSRAKQVSAQCSSYIISDEAVQKCSMSHRRGVRKKSKLKSSSLSRVRGL